MAYKNDKTKNRRRYKTRYRSSHNYKQKRSSSQTKAAVLVSVLTFVVIASVIITFAFGDDIFNYLDKTFTSITQKSPEEKKPIKISAGATTEPEKPTAAVTEAPTEAPTEEKKPEVKQDAAFLQLLKQNNIAETDIVGTQIIFVDANETDNTCKLYCYEKDSKGKWTKALSDFSGFVGAEGVSETMTPYEAKTPIGVFNIEYAAGTDYNPGTGLSYDQFGYDDYWVTDPNSVYYNRWMYTLSSCDWSSAQELWDYTVSYPHCIVFDYNRTNIDHSQGCAKFLHVQDKPTSGGGIGISRTDIVTILKWLEQSKAPVIAISK